MSQTLYARKFMALSDGREGARHQSPRKRTTQVHSHSRTPREDRYRRLNWVQTGPWYNEEMPKHRDRTDERAESVKLLLSGTGGPIAGGPRSHLHKRLSFTEGDASAATRTSALTNWRLASF